MPEDVYGVLRSEIIHGELEPGSPLVEMAIAARLGVSRTPVREALRRLQQDGLVERGDRGMEVRQPSPEEILEIYEVRISLEEMAARSAARSRSVLDLATLRHRLDDMIALGKKPTDQVEMAMSNQRFHEALWAASHNRTLYDLLDRLNSHLTRYRATTLATPGRWLAVLDDHRELIRLIDEQDVEGAGLCAETHMTRARELRLSLYATAIS